MSIVAKSFRETIKSNPDININLKLVSLPTFPPHEAQLPYRLQPNTEWQQSRSHRAGKAAHRLGKEKPSALHKPAHCPGFPVGSMDPSGSWVQSLFSGRPASVSLSCHAPSSFFSSFQEAPTFRWLPPACHPTHMCAGLFPSCPTLCHSMDYSAPGFPVLHYLPELAQTRVHTIGDAIQSSHPLSPTSPLYQTQLSLAYLKCEQIMYVKRWL